MPIAVNWLQRNEANSRRFAYWIPPYPLQYSMESNFLHCTSMVDSSLAFRKTSPSSSKARPNLFGKSFSMSLSVSGPTHRTVCKFSPADMHRV